MPRPGFAQEASVAQNVAGLHKKSLRTYSSFHLITSPVTSTVNMTKAGVSSGG
jgi:hypothetical protein